jgi:hypothetical protein
MVSSHPHSAVVGMLALTSLYFDDVVCVVVDAVVNIHYSRRHVDAHWYIDQSSSASALHTCLARHSTYDSRQALALAADPTLVLPLFDIALVGLPTLFIGYIYIVSES